MNVLGFLIKIEIKPIILFWFIPFQLIAYSHESFSHFGVTFLIFYSNIIINQQKNVHYS